MIETLLSRASAGSFGEAGPSAGEVELILQAAVRAPDHGKLRPWRFVVVSGEGRLRLSELFAKAAVRRDPAAPEAAIEKERSKPLRSALTIVVAARITRGHKIPEIEQTLSAGAAAMNILNAAHALGYGAKWVTGGNCYDPWFKEALGLDPGDPIVGFVHIGTRVEGQAETGRPDPAEFTARL